MTSRQSFRWSYQLQDVSVNNIRLVQHICRSRWYITGRVKQSWRRPRGTHRGDSGGFLWNLYAFLFCSAWVEILPSFNNFLDTHTNPRGHTSHHMLQVDDTLPSSMTPRQFTWHFHRGTTCILFTLGNRRTSGYATHATYAAFPFVSNLRPVTLRNRCTSCNSTHATYTACQRDPQVNIQHCGLLLES